MEQYEVELKFVLDDRTDLPALLRQLGAEDIGVVQQTDTYYRHPVRDFAKTDEALRIRQVEEDCWITYKGPVLDRETKTREEIELPLGEGQSGKIARMLGNLGFQQVRQVAKRRRKFALVFEARSFEIALDEVQGLGRFLELETLAIGEERHEAQQSLLRLAALFGLCQPERRSYLRMLLEIDSR